MLLCFAKFKQYQLKAIQTAKQGCFRILLHSPYSPDLAVFDFLILSNLERTNASMQAIPLPLRRWHHNCRWRVDWVKTEVIIMLNDLWRSKKERRKWIPWTVTMLRNETASAKLYVPNMIIFLIRAKTFFENSWYEDKKWRWLKVYPRHLTVRASPILPKVSFPLLLELYSYII